MKQLQVQLSENDRERLSVLVEQKTLAVAVWRRAQGLLLLDKGHPLHIVAQQVSVCPATVSSWRARYHKDGLALLEDAPRSGRPPHINGLQRAHITALACSSAPEGHARWSVRLLADKAVELGLIQSISHDSVHQILKKTPCNRT